MTKSLPILYQDQDFVAINKPSGLLVHRTSLDRTAKIFAVQTLRDQLGQNVYPVHRLDRATSGALVFALSSEMARELCFQFSEHQVHKKYLAIVRGIPSQEFQVNHPLREELGRMTDLQACEQKSAQKAITEFKTLSSCELPFAVDKYPTSRYSLVEARPTTGRKHQIRRHLKHCHHPVIGDANYGKGKHNSFFANHFGVGRLLLACTEIGFSHPRTREAILVQAPLADDFSLLLKQLGLLRSASLKQFDWVLPEKEHVCHPERHPERRPKLALEI